jgi:aminoglycoside phosphotransferase (APT) family kinase protein
MAMAQQDIRQRLQNWLAAKYPQCENLQITEFRAPAAGASNETLLFDMQWQENAKTCSRSLVARLKPKGMGVFPEYNLYQQYRAMELLGATDVKVPALAGFEDDESVLGTSFYLMECIEGDTVTENPPYHMEGWFKELPAAQRAEIWANGVRAVASVNRVDWQALGFDYLDQPENGETALAQQIKYYEDFLAWAEKKGRAYPKLHSCLAWLKANQPENEPVALCWGDAKVANLLIKGTEVVAVLDWEMVHLGNPVDDLAWWFTLDNSLSDGILQPKLEGLPSREELIALWEEESGHSAEQLPYYELFGALKFGIIMASIGTNLMNDGIFPKESEFDINNPCTLVLDRLMEKKI